MLLVGKGYGVAGVGRAEFTTVTYGWLVRTEFRSYAFFILEVCVGSLLFSLTEAQRLLEKSGGE